MKKIVESRRKETARQLALAMEAKSVSKIQLARMLGKSPSAVTSWLSGNHNFTSDLLAEISEALGTPISGVSMNKFVDGYKLKRSPDASLASSDCTIAFLQLPRAEFECLSQRARSMGVSLSSYAEIILGREARKENVSEAEKTDAFLADVFGAWSGEEFDDIEEKLSSTRTAREIIPL